MKKLLIIAITAISTSANAQWIKSENKDPKISDVSYYINEKDTIAKQWTDLETGEKYVGGANISNYCKFWKAGINNYLSFYPKHTEVEIKPNKHYNIIILLNDYTELHSTGFYYDDDELLLPLTSKEIEYFKSYLIKGYKIEDMDDSYIMEAPKNESDVNLIQKTVNIVWPYIP